MPETSRQAICLGSAEELQDELNQNLIFRLFIKEEENKHGTVVATEKSPICVQDETGATDLPFLNAQYAVVRKAMTTVEAPLMVKVKAYSRGVIACIVLSRQGEDGSEGKNPLVDLVRRMVFDKIMSSRSMAKIKNSAKDAVLSVAVIAVIGEEVARSDQVMKPIAVTVRDQLCHHVQVRLAGERYLYSREGLPTG